jgi:O-antigen ligase
MAKRPQSKKAEPPTSASASSFAVVFSVLLGSFFAVCLLKFSNPPIMEKYIERPAGLFDAIASNPWPIGWAYWLLGLIAIVVGFGLVASAEFRQGAVQNILKVFRGPFLARAVVFLPLLWLGWQVISSFFTLSIELTRQTLAHYAACVGCFYLGIICLHRQKNLWPFFVPILAAFSLVLAIGMDQHFGGLQEMREHVYKEMQMYPEKTYPPEFIKKIGSTRIFSTLFYPNTLAGALLLFAPVMLLATADSAARWRLGSASRFKTITVLAGLTFLCILLYILNSHVGLLFVALFGLSLVFPVPRLVPVALLSAGILAVLIWSGSKAGWLLGLGLIVVLFLSTELKTVSISPKLKVASIILIIVMGLAGFFVRYAVFFKKGATSVSARFDYWHAAVRTAATYPLVGTGPGTFQIPYSRLKRPESEMARLAHNDYLQQGSDSGLPGALFYTAFIVSALIIGRSAWKKPENQTSDVFKSSVLIWIGLLGWAAQCFVEFSLQIPALAWPAFALLGYLCSYVPTSSKEANA